MYLPKQKRIVRILVSSYTASPESTGMSIAITHPNGNATASQFYMLSVPDEDRPVRHLVILRIGSTYVWGKNNWEEVLKYIPQRKMHAEHSSMALLQDRWVCFIRR